RADAARVRDLVSHILNAQKADAEAPRSLADWGLEKPETVVTLKRGDQPALTLNVGKTSPGEESAVTYVLSSDRPKDPVAVPKRDLELVTKDVNSFRERELVAVSTSDIQAVQLSEGKEAGAPAIGLEKSDKGGWRYTAPERFKG